MVDCNTGFRFALAFAGVILSVYSLYVETHAEHDKSFKAMCDINEHVSCTKVFLSKWGRGFGLVEKVLGADSMFNLPNSIAGIVFYSLVMVLCIYPIHLKTLGFLTILSAASCLASVYLATILYHLQDICVVCVSCYVVNFLLLFLNFQRYNELNMLSKYKLE